MYDPATRTWREWKLPGNAHTYSVWVDDRDKVWLTDWSVERDRASSIRSPRSSKRSDPTASNANVRQMLGRAGEAWGAESGTDRLVMVPARP